MRTSVEADSAANGAERPRRRPVVQSLDRGLVILESVAKSGHSVSFTELAELFGIDRSSAFRLADTLKRRGFLACPRNSKGYVLGPSMWRLAQACDWNKTLVKIAHPHLQELAGQSGETAHLAIREGDEALFVDNVLGSQLITVSGQAGDLVPLHCTAHGKALLADYNADQLRKLLGTRPLKAYTAQTITSVDGLAAACAQLQSRGYILDEGEYQDALRCVAAPIRDADGAVIGSIGISAPAARFPEQLNALRAGQVVDAAQAIRAALSVPARRGAAAASFQSHTR